MTTGNSAQTANKRKRPSSKRIEVPSLSITSESHNVNLQSSNPFPNFELTDVMSLAKLIAQQGQIIEKLQDVVRTEQRVRDGYREDAFTLLNLINEHNNPSS